MVDAGSAMMAVLAACAGFAFGAIALPPLSGAATARALRRIRDPDPLCAEGCGARRGGGDPCGEGRLREAGTATEGPPSSSRPSPLPVGSEGCAGASCGRGTRILAALMLAAASGWDVLRVPWILGSEASCSMPFLSQAPAVRCGAAILCWFAMWTALATAVICDTSMRLIPRETCLAIGGAGAIFQGAAGGASALAAGAAFALLSMAACITLNACGRRLRGSPMVGGGDIRCMAALSVASGQMATAGFIACFSVAAAIAVAGCAAGKWKLSTPLPLAPFFCLWLAVGAGGSTI